MTLRETFRRIKTDYILMAKLMSFKISFGRAIFMFFTPSIMAIMIYRFSHFYYTKKFLRPLGWMLWQFNIYLTGVDIMPTSEIGESFYIGHPVGTVISGKLGSGVMMLGQNVIGGGFDVEDIGAGQGLPRIGDRVVLGIRACVLGPVEVGDGAVIGALTLITKSMPAGCTAFGNPAKVVESTAKWDLMRKSLSL